MGVSRTITAFMTVQINHALVAAAPFDESFKPSVRRSSAPSAKSDDSIERLSQLSIVHEHHAIHVRDDLVAIIDETLSTVHRSKRNMT